MALMSMTAWAEDISVVDMSVGNVKYGGSTAPGIFVVWKGETLSSPTQYTWDEKYYTTNACTTEATNPTTSKKYTISDLPVGTYYVKITGVSTGGFSGSKVGSFAVEKADATLTLKTSLTKEYGAKDPAAPTSGGYTITDAASNDITASFTGTLAYSYEGENAGTHALTFSGLTNDNYTLKSTEVITITAKPLATTDYTITAEQKDVVYTGKDIIGQYTIKVGDKTLVQGDKTSKTADFWVAAVKNAGATVNKPTITFFNNYSGTATPKDGFKVTPAPITVSVDDIEVDYDGTNQADQLAAGNAKFNYSGIVGDDVATATTIIGNFTAPTAVAVASAAINAGDYTLVISGGNTNTQTNYEFKTYLPATLTINPFEVTIKAKDETKNVGDADPTWTVDPAYKTSLPVSGDYVTGVTFTRADGEDPGDYAITPNVSAAKMMRPDSDPTKPATDVTSNYTFTASTKGKLTIGKGAIVVTIKNATKFYGEEDPTFTYKVTGLQDGDVLDFDADDIVRTAGEKPGNYSLTAEVVNPNTAKYTSLTVVPGILTIAKAQLEFTIPTQNVATDVDKTALKKDGITVAGINNTDAAATLYDLDFNAATVTLVSGKTSTDETVDDGIVATLSTTGTLTVDGKAVAITDLYEIVTGKTKTVVTAAYGKLIVGDGTWTSITLKRADKADIDDTAIGGNNDAAAQIKKHAGETIGIYFGTYEMLPEKWYPLVFPFETTVADISQRFEYAVVNVLNKANTDPKKISFKLHMGTIPANTPFVVKVYGSKANDYKVDMANAWAFISQIVAPSDYAAVTTADAVDASGVKFIGTYTGKTDGFRSNQYYFSASADYNQYYQGNATNTTYLRPLGAYLEVPSNEAGARIIELEEADGTITAIQVARTDNGAANNAEGWYTIGGVKLQGAPTKKGVYIQNGKKVIVK